MAYFVQKVALAFLVAASQAGAAAFSHKVHLKLKLPCTMCHTAARASARVEDNLLPKQAVCAGCHRDGRGRGIGRRPRPALLAKFSHAKHLKLGDIAPVLAKAIDSGEYLSAPGDARRHLNTSNQCAACHGGLEETDQLSAAHFPRMADCLVCHNKIELPFSCVTCHGEGAKLRPASHTADFEDRHSSPKMEKAGCAVCHGRVFTCRGCH
ncbi:MAG TPA: cytochrome c3 family protein [Bryobacteraceae bacterium]|nr:cytochrome c3 family protein [Bryobacteraceae bacterium]